MALWPYFDPYLLTCDGSKAEHSTRLKPIEVSKACEIHYRRKAYAGASERKGFPVIVREPLTAFVEPPCGIEPQT
jgi:hypothetical protein